MTERRRVTDMDTTLQRFVSISTVGVGLVTVLAFAGTIASFIADAKTNEILMPTSKQVEKNTVTLAAVVSKQREELEARVRMEAKQDRTIELLMSLKDGR
jgi:hypothetical protein